MWVNRPLAVMAPDLYLVSITKIVRVVTSR
jgi:hypothetical protein